MWLMAFYDLIISTLQVSSSLLGGGGATTNSVLWVAENTLGVHCSFCTIWRVMALAPLVCMAMKCKFTLNK